MATIDQRGKKSWRARVRLPGYKLKTRTFDTRAQAEIWAERTERELHSGNDTIPNVAAEPTLAEALERYEREITKDKKSHEQEPAHRPVVPATALEAQALKAESPAFRDLPQRAHQCGNETLHGALGPGADQSSLHHRAQGMGYGVSGQPHRRRAPA